MHLFKYKCQIDGLIVWDLHEMVSDGGRGGDGSQRTAPPEEQLGAAQGRPELCEYGQGSALRHLLQDGLPAGQVQVLPGETNTDLTNTSSSRCYISRLDLASFTKNVIRLQSSELTLYFNLLRLSSSGSLTLGPPQSHNKYRYY